MYVYYINVYYDMPWSRGRPMGILILIKLVEELPSNSGPASQLNGPSKHSTRGRDDSHVGHTPLEEPIYCERQVI